MSSQHNRVYAFTVNSEEDGDGVEYLKGMLNSVENDHGWRTAITILCANVSALCLERQAVR